MTYKEICDIWPYGARILCKTAWQRFEVTKIALESGFEHCASGYSRDVLFGRADGIFMHPLHSKRADGASYINYNRGKESWRDDITYEEFISRVNSLDTEFECGDLESLLYGGGDE